MQKYIEKMLEEKGVFVSTIVGVSMYPMLKNRRDTIAVVPCNGRLKKYDVPLYKRGEQYVLHRIMEVRPESYVILGDNCIQKEYNIKDQDIIGVLQTFYRNGMEVNMHGLGYKLYARVWLCVFPLRKMFKKIKQTIRGERHAI